MTVSQQHSGQGHSISEGVLRVLFGVFLAVIAIGLALSPWPELFAAITVLMSLFAAREWHRMVRAPDKAAEADRKPLHIQTIITGVTTACALTALVLRVVPAAFAFLVLGTIASYIWASRHDDNPLWHAGGVAYIGIPSMALVALRVFPLQPQLIVLGLFMIVWATDTGALVFGKLIGGPKIAPHLSPGKTWAGTLGGSITAAMVYGLYIALFGFDAETAMLFAFAFSFVAHAGDLFESLVKRRFGLKNSGGLIPGHGGILDRVDSLFAASMVMAVLVFGFHFNPLFGGRVL
ncbi:MAG TPA: phosphatidate cytidylyltransferase [Rhizomicrobium sp.]|nr:phosphatidate cytidylyltransferase [Rhizomicrobium sp.]